MSGSLEDVKNRILGKISLASLIGEQVQLTTRAGKAMGCCPFHAEKTPSFHIYDDNHYYCFGCKERGDAISYVRRREGLSFVDALRHLAKKYAVEAPELELARGRLATQNRNASLFKMMLEAQEFYVHELWASRGGEALAYLKGRGFSEENIKAFGFGFTPEFRNGLVKHLRDKSYSEDDMISCSLALPSSQSGGRPFDFLRERFTLPIHDIQGRIIAFGGRTMTDQQPKYLNSKETKLFDKSQTLFGFDKARRVMRDKGRALVVEGYMDTLQLWQNGFTETVACLGTSFTEWQVKQLKHATGALTLLFDGDSAGQRATLAAVSVALAVPEVHVRACALPSGEDPDSYVRKHGPEKLEELLQGAVDLFDFAVREKIKGTHQLAIPALVSKEFVPWLAKIPDRMQRSFLVSRIAQLTGISKGGIEAQIITPPGSVSRSRVEQARAGGIAMPPASSPLEPGVMDLFGHIYYATPDEIDVRRIQDEALRELTLSVEHAALIDELLACLEQGVSPATRDLREWTLALDPNMSILLEKLAKEAAAFSCSDRPARLDRVIAHFRALRVKRTIHLLKSEMHRLMSVPGSQDDVAQLLKTIGELNGELRAKAAP